MIPFILSIVSTIGLTEAQYTDSSREFDGKPRLIEVAIWYPASPSTPTQNVEFGIWKIQDAARNAPLYSQEKKLPLVLFSHGYSGNQWVGTWFAEYLAARGYIVAVVRHYGNSYRNMIPELCARPWNRPQDLKFALDQLLEHPLLKEHIDTSRIGAAGFSQGGITSMWLGGVQAALSADILKEQITVTQNPILQQMHFKDIPAQRPNTILDNFTQKDFDQANQSYRDERIKAAFVIAPGIDEKNVMFTKEGLSKACIPMHIQIGQAEERQAIDDASFFAQAIPHCLFTVIPGEVGHMTLLNEGTEEGKKIKPEYTVDHPSVDRAAVHAQVAADALHFFETHL
ncbi:MAG: hypothetical protein JSR46_10785 [Verrucomicrobia bacterium]|nr:hypothetical protein [Verrucomicrobiota bacterium]